MADAFYFPATEAQAITAYRAAYDAHDLSADDLIARLVTAESTLATERARVTQMADRIDAFLRLIPKET